MNSNLYELISIGARYVFALIMLVIVIRAWKITIVDSRRANRLRRLSPETGVCGEFLVMTGSGKVREGMRFPVIREGLIGSSRKADIRLRCPAVHRSHAFFELTQKGLRLRAQGRSRMYSANGSSRKELLLGDGGRLTIGHVELMLILTEGTSTGAEPERDELFDLPDDSLRELRRHVPETRPVVPAHDAFAEDDLFRTDTSSTASASPNAFESDITFRPPDDTLSSAMSEIHNRHRLFNDAYAETDEEAPAAYVPSAPHEAPAADPDDLFMEDIPVTVRPESSTPWDDDDDDPPAKVWDDWDDIPAKPKVKRKKYDDPFDV